MTDRDPVPPPVKMPAYCRHSVRIETCEWCSPPTVRLVDPVPVGNVGPELLALLQERYSEPDPNMAVVYVCHLCGQVLGQRDTCSSGIHVGPDGGQVGLPVRTDALVAAHANAERHAQNVLGQQVRLRQEFLDVLTDERSFYDEGGEGWKILSDAITRLELPKGPPPQAE